MILTVLGFKTRRFFTRFATFGVVIGITCTVIMLYFRIEKSGFAIQSLSKDSLIFHIKDQLESKFNGSDKYALDYHKTVMDYSLTPQPCGIVGTVPFLVILVISKPGGFDRRQVIRKTWGSLANPICGVRRYFLLGRILDKEISSKLVVEAAMYGDIIQANKYDDQYRSSSTKTLFGYQWVATFCPQAVFTSRIDDDNWLNLPKFYEVLKKSEFTEAVYGSPIGAGSTVVRRPDTKYGIPREEYGPDFFPEYSSGMFFTVPTKTIKRILYFSKKIPTVFLDDVYIAGLLAKAANLSRVSLPEMAWSPGTKETECEKRDRICIHYVSVSQFYELWNDQCHTYNELCV
ncbi:beta-1,3-galactosyltransferase 5-like [Paramacrobiotus metropolitanus]|uniref:beta-1,3-galactosyltransferase 5-like n=1 Tax=Paramacrobiotus metropolitanus TaxID=2943436 RepID=UPI00244578DB|nr:beta-1,3-galactosyltransferase 5-like [Paramacrobiotus metropolitanus]